MTPRNDETSVGQIYDWWSHHPRVLDSLYVVAFLSRERAFRQQAIEA